MPLILHHEHPWDLTPKEAVQLQKQLNKEIINQPLPKKIERVGGLDVGYKGIRARAAAVVLDFATMKMADQSVIEMEVLFHTFQGFFHFEKCHHYWRQ